MRKRPKITEYRFDQWADDLRDWIAEAVSPFENDTPEKQRERKERAAHDRLFFFQTYLPHYFHGEFGEFHGEWSDLCDVKDQAVLVAAPREHAKSTFFTFGLPLHDVCFAVKKFLMIVSDTNDQATGFTLPIRLELEENKRLLHDFGPQRGKTWTKSDFTTSRGVRVLARGRGERIRGLKNRQHRPDRAIVDDFENDVNVENPKLVTAGLRWLRRAVMGSMGAGYSWIMVGNLFHPKSVLSQLIAEKDEEGRPLYISRVYRAILDEGKPDQRPLWPAAWPMERLLKKREQMGRRDFNAEMQNLTTVEDAAIREAWFVYYEREELAGKALVVASFTDPSAKGTETTDFKAIITVGLDRSTMIYYVLDAWIRHASPGEMFKAAYAANDRWGGPMGIEENMLEDFLHEAILNYAREVGRFLPWRPVRHNTNKIGRIVGTLAYLIEHGHLRFMKGQSDQDVLVEQLIYLENQNINDDGPDSLEGAVNLLQTGATGIPPITTGSRREMRRRLEKQY